jgi:hypothetical protein
MIYQSTVTPTLTPTIVLMFNETNFLLKRRKKRKREYPTVEYQSDFKVELTGELGRFLQNGPRQLRNSPQKH